MTTTKSSTTKKKRKKSLVDIKQETEAANAAQRAAESAATALEVAAEVLTTAMTQTLEAIEAKEREKEADEQKMCADDAVRTIQIVAAWDGLAHDVVDWGQSSWTEPVADDGDRWMRGSVSRRSKKAFLRDKTLLDMALEAPSEGSRVSRSQTSSSPHHKRRSPPKPKSPEPTSIYTVAEDEEYLEDAHYAMMPLQSRISGLTKSEETPEERLKRLDDMYRAEADAFESKVAALQGRPYTTDAEGNIILIKSIDASDDDKDKKKKRRNALNGEDQLPNYSIREVARERIPRHNRHRSPPKDDDQSVVFQCDASEQPSLVSKELQLSVAEGVKVRRGDDSLAGPPLLKDPDHPSKAEFETSRGTCRRRPPILGAETMTTTQMIQQLPATENVDALQGGRPQPRPIPASRRPSEDINLALTRAPDWGSVGPLRDPVVGRVVPKRRRHTLPRLTRVRLPKARPTKKLDSLYVATGLSEVGRTLYNNSQKSLHDDNTSYLSRTTSVSALSLPAIPPPSPASLMAPQQGRY